VPGLAKNKHRFVVAARPTWEAKFVAVPEPMWSRRAAAIEQKGSQFVLAAHVPRGARLSVDRTRARNLSLPVDFY
jgi:hypothetical protein